MSLVRKKLQDKYIPYQKGQSSEIITGELEFVLGLLRKLKREYDDGVITRQAMQSNLDNNISLLQDIIAVVETKDKEEINN